MNDKPSERAMEQAEAVLDSLVRYDVDRIARATDAAYAAGLARAAEIAKAYSATKPFSGATWLRGHEDTRAEIETEIRREMGGR